MSGKAQENYRKNPCIVLAKYEKYLTERVLPSFRVCLKNHRKSLNHAFESEFLSDAESSHQLTERLAGHASSGPASIGIYVAQSGAVVSLEVAGRRRFTRDTPRSGPAGLES